MTEYGKFYNIYSEEDGTWLAYRKNGSLFMKTFRPGCAEYTGGKALDVALGKNIGFRAVEVGVDP
jgi:hypothetical protein